MEFFLSHTCAGLLIVMGVISILTWTAVLLASDLINSPRKWKFGGESMYGAVIISFLMFLMTLLFFPRGQLLSLPPKPATMDILEIFLALDVILLLMSGLIAIIMLRKRREKAKEEKEKS